VACKNAAKMGVSNAADGTYLLGNLIVITNVELTRRPLQGDMEQYLKWLLRRERVFAKDNCAAVGMQDLLV
jgi:hypothetical protein